MVKNSGINQPTDMVRLGKNSDSEQPKNSIVFNASENKIRDIKHSGLYISPIRNAFASNLLAYDSITNEVVDVGGMKLKLSDLQVENLDVLNLTALNEQHVYTPVLEIGEGCKSTEDIGIDMHGVKLTHTKKDGHLTINTNTKVIGSLEASQFIGDGGLLSNVQYDLNIDIGEVVENLHVVGELKGDGGMLSNITVSQIKDFDGYSPKFDHIHAARDITCERSIYVNNRVHAKGNINSDGKIIATSFHGDGTTLSGISKLVELQASNERIGNLETQISRFEPLETSQTIFENSISILENQIKRFDPLEQTSASLEDRISKAEPRIQKLETYVPIINTSQRKILEIEKSIEIIPQIHALRSDIDNINTHIPVIYETNKIVPTVHENESRITEIETKITRLSEIDVIKETLLNFGYVYKELERLDPIVSNVGMCENMITLTRNEISDLPEIRTRLSTLESSPLEGDGSLISNISLTHVLSCSNETNKTIKTSESVVASTFVIEGTPRLTSRLGEINGLTMSSFAEINAYTKSNNGTTAGNTGGIVFKTRDIDGNVNPRMTLDGNGKLSVGTIKGHPSAILTLESNTSGFLPPRMTSDQIKSINNPEPGLMVYDIDNDTLFIYKRSGWSAMC